MDVSLKYAHVERERRFLLRSLPPEIQSTVTIADRYLSDTRLRLREVTAADGSVQRKLGHKVRLGRDASEIAHTSLYLDDAEWALMSALPGHTLIKTRHVVVRDGYRIAVDQFADGTLLAEIDDGDEPASPIPEWLDVIREVSAEEGWTGAQLARTRHGD